MRGMPVKEVVKNLIFWHIFTMLMLSMSFSYFMKPSLKNYGSHKSFDDAFLTITGSLAFLVSACAKFAWGAI